MAISNKKLEKSECFPVFSNASFNKELQTNRNGNSAIFLSYVCNGKIIEELFASTLNGVTASVRCVSSSMFVIKQKGQ